MTEQDVERLIEAISSYLQADREGIVVSIERQACDEAAAALRALQAENAKLREALTFIRDYGWEELEPCREEQEDTYRTYGPSHPEADNHGRRLRRAKNACWPEDMARPA